MNNKLIVVILLYLIVLYVSCIYYDYQYVQLEEKLAAKQNEMTSIQNELSTTKENLQLEIEKVLLLNTEIDIANNTISELKDDKYNLVYLGDFKLTHYCVSPYEHICGTGTGLTATGTQVTAGRSIAVDPNVIPYGSQVYIQGYGWYVAEDCGGAVKDNHIDIAVSTHEQALDLGTTTGGVWILIK